MRQPHHLQSPPGRTAPTLWSVSPPGWFKAFQDLPREHGPEPLQVEGTLPEDLQGTLYRVGPGLFSGFGKRYDHWFDGDGAVSAVRFGGGGAQGSVRVIETEHRVREQRGRRGGLAGVADQWRLTPGDEFSDKAFELAARRSELEAEAEQLDNQPVCCDFFVYRLKVQYEDGSFNVVVDDDPGATLIWDLVNSVANTSREQPDKPQS